jgi:drug/metabolite transporter (DMT)-like permease
MMGILFGVLTALFWGGSDFVARFATRRIGTLRTMLYMQAFGFLLLTFFLYAFGLWGHLFDGSGWRPWAWGLLGGGLNATGTLALYRSFEIGKMSVVAPLSASYPVITIFLSVLSGEHLTFPRAIGVSLTIAGVIIVAGGEKVPDENDAEAVAQNGKGIGYALIAAVGFGVMMWLLGTRVVARTGPFASVWLIRMVGTLVAATILFVNKSPRPRGSSKGALQIAGIGVLDSAAFIMNNRGMQLEQVAVVSVLASLYGAVTVALAALFLREHVSRWQWGGIIAVFSGIYLISR